MLCQKYLQEKEGRTRRGKRGGGRGEREEGRGKRGGQGGGRGEGEEGRGKRGGEEDKEGRGGGISARNGLGVQSCSCSRKGAGTRLLTLPKLPLPSTTRRLNSSRFILGSPRDSGTISEPRRKAMRASLSLSFSFSRIVALRNSSISCRDQVLSLNC